jgi:hypothetical protein
MTLEELLMSVKILIAENNKILPYYLRTKEKNVAV